MNDKELMKWFGSEARPFLERHAQDRLPALESDFKRLQDLLQKPDEVTVCFLGNSGVGKSTLLNALAAGSGHVLPAGGIGPLTAQATEVRFSEVPSFKVTYHPKGHLWRIGFALEASLLQRLRIAAKGATDDAATASDDELTRELDPETLDELKQTIESAGTDVRAAGKAALDAYAKQAKHVVCGDQFAERELEYLVEGIRLACGTKPRWGGTLSADDAARVQRVHDILKRGAKDRTYVRRESDGLPGFSDDLAAHAAGFLSPLIERIEVGWPSALLKTGVVLVDLPGVGIAQDSYRDVTKKYIREKARAVVLVVDRAGPTESTVDLLRTSGYWDRLVGAADDPSSDPCTMLIAVTRVDDVTLSKWQEFSQTAGATRPKKREVFAELVEEFKPRMRAQISEQLGKIGDSSNEAVRVAREQARLGLLSSLEIHPVSAPEFRKILADDEEDPPFLKDVEQSGIPALQDSLISLTRSERGAREAQLAEVRERLERSALSEVEIVGQFWQRENRAAEEAERLEAALKAIVDPKQEESGRRAGAFREFLRATVQAKIEALVLEARDAAEEEVEKYLRRLQGAHWGTLRAAVRRGGAFHGSIHINLPDDISGYFQEPMAAVWGQRLLVDVRKRTSELANDIEQMVIEICEWAGAHGGTSVNQKLLDAQIERVKTLSAQMKAVGREAVDELRETVKRELTSVIRAPIKQACDRFVQAGDDIGPGVKVRILELFQTLAKKATTAARDPAIQILRSNFEEVRKEIQNEFKKGGDPINDTAAAIVERHEDRVKRSDAQRRGPILQDYARVVKAHAAARSASVPQA
jgi:GTP-binding protein EngB required for normal cell division